MLVGVADNFHRTWAFDIKGLAESKGNTIEIKVKSVYEYS